MQFAIEKTPSEHDTPDSSDEPLPLFRRQALRSMRHRRYGDVSLVTPPSAWAVTMVSILALVLLATAAASVEVPERIRTVGVLLPESGVFRVRAQYAGWVEALHVENGDTVRRGQVLLRVSDRQRAPNGRTEAIGRVASLEREQSLMLHSASEEIAAVERRHSSNQLRRQLLKRRLDTARSALDTARARQTLQEARVQRVTGLAERALIARQVFEEQRSAALQASAVAEAAMQHMQIVEDELIQIEQQIDADERRPLQIRIEVQARQEALGREIAAGRLRITNEVIAPDDGQVDGIAIRVGQFVRAGQLLLALHEPGERLDVHLYINADEVGVISPGQAIELQSRALPYQRHGTLSAIVRSVSTVPVFAEELDLPLPISGPVFEVRAALEETESDIPDIRRLVPGSILQADVISRRRPLYLWLLHRTFGHETADA